ncbi:MAG: SelB C-terminal domain-containing protein, partial [Fidelibacterota bacterium]
DQVMGRVYLAGRDRGKELRPGEGGAALIRLEKDVAVAMDDPLIIRFYSPAETIGGGTVIDALPPVPWKTCRPWIGSLDGLARPERLERYLERHASDPLSLQAWSRRWQAAPGIVRRWLEDLPIVEFGPSDNPFVTLAGTVHVQGDRLVETLERYHRDSPYKEGIPRDDLRRRVGLSAPLFDHVVSGLESDGRIEGVGGLVRLEGFRPRFSPKDTALARRVETIVKEAAFTPPTLKEMAAKLDLDESRILDIMHVLKREGHVVDVGRDLWFHADLMAALERDIRNFFRRKGSLAVPEFKSMTRTTRKHAIPLLEYLDRKKVTRRRGDERIPG